MNRSRVDVRNGQIDATPLASEGQATQLPPLAPLCALINGRLASMCRHLNVAAPKSGGFTLVFTLMSGIEKVERRHRVVLRPSASRPNAIGRACSQWGSQACTDSVIPCWSCVLCLPRRSAAYPEGLGGDPLVKRHVLATEPYVERSSNGVGP